MKRTKKWLLMVMASCGVLPGIAQQKTTFQFDAFLEKILQPKPTLEEMMEANPGADMIDRTAAATYKTINGALSFLYQPIYERYQKAVAGKLALLTKAEQAIAADMKQGARGLSVGVQFDLFKTLMAKRPTISHEKPLWSNTAIAKAITVQQLRNLEAAFDWKGFHQAAESYLPKFGVIDPTIEALNKKLAADTERLPRKKVTMAGGFSSEMEDPDQMIRLWKQHGADKQKAFGRQYGKIFSWWNAQYAKLRSIAETLNAIDAKLAGADEQEAKAVQPFLADLQIRTWEAFYQLAAVSQRLYNDTLIAMASEQQVTQTIKIYTELKASPQ